MSEVAGLLVLTSNYTFKDVIDNDNELRVVTSANIQVAEITKLQSLGWELAGPCVAVFKKEEVDEQVPDPYYSGPNPVDKLPIRKVEPQPDSE